MANRIRKEVKNNLKAIRKELNLTQAEMGEILGVSDTMIKTYETFGDNWAANLPIDLAMCISKKFNYSLDYIYANTKNKNKTKINDNFIADIRELITYDEDKIYFSISDSFWDYMNNEMEISNLTDTKQNKANKKLELNAKYTNGNDNNYKHTISFLKEDFEHGLFVNNEFFPLCDEKISDADNYTPKPWKHKKIQEFFESIDKSNENETKP